MSEITVLENKFYLDIESNIAFDNRSVLSNDNVQISSPNEYNLNIEASYVSSVNNIEIHRYNDYDLSLTNTVYANLPDAIPMSIITGNIDVARIDNLDVYLSTVPIDGGSP
jgi:hypothetical protein